MTMHRFDDIHTHTEGRHEAVLSVAPELVEDLLLRDQEQCFSLELHPWHLKSEEDIRRFEQRARQLASHPQLVAIGECGLDPLCPTPLPLQHQAFVSALRIARELGLPVVIHCVKLWDEMMRDVAQVFSADERREAPIIIHGFRKGPQLARQLLDAGFSISLGALYNEKTREVIPADRLYRETD